MKSTWLRTAVIAGFVIAGLGCGGDDSVTGPDLTTIDGVLESLQESYLRRNPGAYAALLADDFRFFLDPVTAAAEGAPESWGRNEDVAATTSLLTSDRVRDIRMDLEHDPVLPANELGRESWYRDPVKDTFLEVDLAPDPGEFEETTLSIRGQKQTIYLRKGKSPADTLATSDTADRFYIVEWRDHGRPHFAASPPGDGVLPTREMTWTLLKLEFLPGF